MYIEDTLADVIRAAAESGKIPGLAGEDVFTDMTGTNEWEGRSKFYVIRETTDLLGDLADGIGYSGAARSKLTLAAVGKDKVAALGIIRAALAAVRRHLNSGPEPLDEYTIDEGDEITVDEGDEICVDWEEGGLDIVEIDEGDTVTIDDGDTAVFGRIAADGEVAGGGWIIACQWTGNILPWLIYQTGALDVDDWRLDAASGVERFDAGSWREQYYQTKTLDLVHQVEAE